MHTMAGIHNSWSKVLCWEGWVAFQDLTSHVFYEAGRVLNGALHNLGASMAPAQLYATQICWIQNAVL